MLVARPMRARRALGLVSMAAVLANSTWFSATAVIPALERDWDLDPAGASSSPSGQRLLNVAKSFDSAVAREDVRTASRPAE